MRIASAGTAAPSVAIPVTSQRKARDRDASFVATQATRRSRNIGKTRVVFVS